MRFKLPDLQYFRYEIKEWWERLGIRRWINKNPGIVIGISVVSVVVLVVIVIGQLTPEKTVEIEQTDKAWFYDLNTGKLFVAESDRIPPIDAPSGPLPNGEPAGVKAYVFSYAYEPNESERFIGFLETTDPNATNNIADSNEPGTMGSKQWGKGKFIRRIKDEYWVPADSYWGRDILKRLSIPNENGDYASYCPPK